jgi:hypothetical protein
LAGGGEAYLRLDYDAPIKDGMTYLNHELFCQFNAANGLWYVQRERSEWPSVLVKKA